MKSAKEGVRASGENSTTLAVVARVSRHVVQHLDSHCINRRYRLQDIDTMLRRSAAAGTGRPRTKSTRAVSEIKLRPSEVLAMYGCCSVVEKSVTSSRE